MVHFEKARYLNLETYRRTGAPVRTPVWFALGDGTLYIYTLAGAGKVKRIRNQAAVRVAPCSMRGALTGDWQAGTARIVEGPEVDRAHALLNRKYWPKRLVDFLSPGRRTKQRIIAVMLADATC